MTTKTKKRIYKRITPRTVAQHNAQVIANGNGAAAVRATDPDYKDEYSRAVRLAAKSNTESTAAFIDKALEQIGVSAIQRVSELVMSNDERIASKNAHFVIEHIRGKAVQRSVSITGKLNIQNVLD